MLAGTGTRAEGFVQWGLFGVTLTGLQLQLPRWYMRAECVLGRVGLDRSIHWFVYERELGTALTR